MLGNGTSRMALCGARLAAVVHLLWFADASCQIAPEDFTEGTAPSNYVGWTFGPPGAVAIDAIPDPASAPGALWLGPTNPAAFARRVVLAPERAPWATGTVAFVDVWMRPVAAPTNAPTAIGIDGAKIGFFAEGGTGRAFAFDGDGLGGGTCVPLGYAFAAGAGGASSNWVHVALRLDYSNHWYDVWLDGTLYAAAAGIDAFPAPSVPSEFVFEGDGGAPVWLDLPALSAENPLFDDADRDGMPDQGFELTRGLDPNANDRDFDADSDGWSNIEEFLAGTAPDDAASLPSTNGPALFYVDGDLGDDLFNGMASHPSAAGGPKRTVGAGFGAIAALGFPSAGLVVRGSTNSYREAAIVPGTNTVILRPIGSVKIQPPIP